MQPLLLTLDEGYLLTINPPDLERGVASLGPLAPGQLPLLGRAVAPLGHASARSIAASALFAHLEVKSLSHVQLFATP